MLKLDVRDLLQDAGYQQRMTLLDTLGKSCPGPVGQSVSYHLSDRYSNVFAVYRAIIVIHIELALAAYETLGITPKPIRCAVVMMAPCSPRDCPARTSSPVPTTFTPSTVPAG